MDGLVSRILRVREAAPRWVVAVHARNRIIGGGGTPYRALAYATASRIERLLRGGRRSTGVSRDDESNVSAQHSRIVREDLPLEEVVAGR